MEQETLHAAKRVASGSRASKRLRRDGRVPGVVYGTPVASQPIHVSSRELYSVLHTEAGLNAIIELDKASRQPLEIPNDEPHPVSHYSVAVSPDASRLAFVRATSARMDLIADAAIACVGPIFSASVRRRRASSRAASA